MDTNRLALLILYRRLQVLGAHLKLTRSEKKGEVTGIQTLIQLGGMWGNAVKLSVRGIISPYLIEIAG